MLEGFRSPHRYQVDDVSAVGHSGEKGVLGAEIEFLLKLFGKGDEELHVIGLHPFLGRIADIPARFPFRILYPLRVAYGEPVPVGDIHHRFFALEGRAAVAVEDNHERGSCLESFRTVEVIFPLKSLVLHRVAFAPFLYPVLVGGTYIRHGCLGGRLSIRLVRNLE